MQSSLITLGCHAKLGCSLVPPADFALERATKSTPGVFYLVPGSITIYRLFSHAPIDKALATVNPSFNGNCILLQPWHGHLIMLSMGL